MATKWQYMRSEVPSLEEMDNKLEYYGNLGWELVSTLHSTSTLRTTKSPTAPGEYEKTEGWILVFKQPRIV